MIEIMKTILIISVIMCLIGAYILDTTKMPSLGGVSICLGILGIMGCLMFGNLPNQDK